MSSFLGKKTRECVIPTLDAVEGSESLSSTLFIFIKVSIFKGIPAIRFANVGMTSASVVGMTIVAMLIMDA